MKLRTKKILELVYEYISNHPEKNDAYIISSDLKLPKSKVSIALYDLWSLKLYTYPEKEDSHYHLHKLKDLWLKTPDIEKELFIKYIGGA